MSDEKHPKEQNPMRNISIEKIVLNCGCGTKGNIDHAKFILEKTSGKTAVITNSKKRSLFGVPKGKPIGCKVTIRAGAEKELVKLLKAVDNKLSPKKFDKTGNLAFGIKEYIDIPGMQYEPKIGIIGFDVCVTLMRPGYRVKRKHIASLVGKPHAITKAEAIKFMQDKFGVNTQEEE